MKRLTYLLIVFASLWLVTGCASFEGNGVSASLSWTDPQTGATIDIHTAK